MESFLFIVGLILIVVFRAAAQSSRRGTLPPGEAERGEAEPGASGADAVAEAQARALEALRRWEVRQRAAMPEAFEEETRPAPAETEPARRTDPPPVTAVEVAPEVGPELAPQVAPAPRPARPASGPSLAGTPASWRQAILHAEILSRPVALRARRRPGRPGSGDPGGGGDR
ncbi:MAG: hypothetical protein ACE5HF_08435 [Gemmatimonadota bacterium]